MRAGVGRFGANMLRWGLSTSDCCDCGAEQTADLITSGRYNVPKTKAIEPVVNFLGRGNTARW